MILVGKIYKTFGGQSVKIVTGSNNQFTGDNGVRYDKFGRTERGHDLCLKLVTVAPAYEDEPLTENEQELLEALTEIVESWDEETAYFNSIGITSDKKGYIERARDVIAKFERVQS